MKLNKSTNGQQKYKPKLEREEKWRKAGSRGVREIKQKYQPKAIKTWSSLSLSLCVSGSGREVNLKQSPSLAQSK